ncbi:hypothetical protein SAMN05216490_4675 [Mucilaginibacter mallensis]|uniref:HEPN domain-containing protein n=1 Tax=Mucilaginibacter mallensis TaxID=652787 RepID=A0A1H2C6P3_MUCMA|nr:hypothetical protein [Mucilaginibacter mallensis]SDT66061.1 hypothetical protein SAMN05216490_4675 [Mucilaginibacter mallensis]
MKPIFSRNDDIDKIAFLNWRIRQDDDIRNMLNLADGFMTSSIRLAKLCLIYNNDKSADILIFPILTNANHGIELYLKAITWTLNIIMNSNAKIEGSHNIKQIYQTLKSKIKAYKGSISIKEFEKSTLELSEYIAELFDKIKATKEKDNMDFSRYPFNNKYEQHFYVDMIGNVEIDLENFISRFEIIKDRLDIISDFLFDQELNQDLAD